MAVILEIQITYKNQMKLYSILFLTFFFLKTSGQNISKNTLVEILRNYENEVYNDAQKDSIWTSFINEFETTIENAASENTTFDQLRKYCDSTYFQFDTFLAEDRKRMIYKFSNGFEYLNYVVKKFSDETNNIVVKDNRSHYYFTEIHQMNNNEFLLLLRMDEMSFSCIYAQVLSLNDGNVIRKEAFGKNNQELLSVCSWTNIDNTFTVKENATELYETERGMQYLKPIAINFDPSSLIISYSFNRLKDGRKMVRKAKYKNGHFKIKNYDARLFDD